MFRERKPRLANLGYFGHVWELYALWTSLPAFLLAATTHRATADPSPHALGLLAFTVIGPAGVVGCLLGGWATDRYGRAPIAGSALAISGACCLASPLLYGAPWAVLIPILLLWGAAVIADSGVFSALLSEVADPRYVGTALTAQTAIGFLLTVASISLVPVLADLVGWRYAFVALGVGPVFGGVAMRALAKEGRNELASQTTRGIP
jgi:MFS family permease